MGGVGLHEQLVTAFGLDEVLEAAVRGGLDVPGEAGGGIRGGGVEAVDRIVTRFDGALLLGLRLAHVDGVGDAGGVGEDDGRAIVRFGLLEGLQGLLAVIAEGDGGDIDVSVAHAHEAHVLLVGLLAAGGELGDGRGRGGLGGLSAGVGIDFRVEDEDVDVAVLGDDVVDAAVADVVGPAVTTDDPDGFVGEEVGQFVDLRDDGAAACRWLASLQFLKNKALISRHYLI